MAKEPERLEIDIPKIFFTPPTSMREKVTLFLMMLVIFIMFFGPTIFTEISPSSLLFRLFLSPGAGWCFCEVCSGSGNFPRIPAIKRKSPDKELPQET